MRGLGGALTTGRCDDRRRRRRRYPARRFTFGEDTVIDNIDLDEEPGILQLITAEAAEKLTATTGPTIP